MPLTTTSHRILFENASDMRAVADGQVALMVTSPPYPMIEMWDTLFETQNAKIGTHLKQAHGFKAFEAMHALLDPVWREVHRVLAPGGIACINIGDATRTLDGSFTLYPNKVRILQKLIALGFNPLPQIIWRKQTNAPNKFMGSGMMPPGAYVTLEHEHILIVRKGALRTFPSAEAKANRRESAYFWEERNQWFSDVWLDLKGTRQNLAAKGLRQRSAAFPFELAYRLINMFSVKGDTVLDPFCGLGTTLAAAAASGRSSIGFELTHDFEATIKAQFDDITRWANRIITRRIDAHLEFIAQRLAQNKPVKNTNRPYGFPVITRQEAELFISPVAAAEAETDDTVRVQYACPPEQPAFADHFEHPADGPPKVNKPQGRPRKTPAQSRQMQLHFDN